MSERCVIKLGGSFLVQSSAPERVRELLVNEFAGVQVNLVIGGGVVVDALPELDAVHRFCPIEMHWRAVRALRLTFELAGEWFPDARRVETKQAFAAHRHYQLPGHCLIAVDSFYDPSDGDVLPRDWTTTADSIAALLARKLSIERLVIIKSCAVPAVGSIKQLADAGIVDAAFEQASSGLKIEWRTVDA